MGFFKDLKFGVNAEDKKFPSTDLNLEKNGINRTEGSFAPGYSNKFLQNPVNFVTGLVTPEGGGPNSNKDPGWQPTIFLRPVVLNTKGTKNLTSATYRFAPGFLPPGALAQQIVDKDRGKGKGYVAGNVGINAEYVWSEGNEWIGQLINSHLESPYYLDFTRNYKSLETSQKINEEKAKRTIDEPFSARDYYIRFNDQHTDYFRHGLHIEGLTPVPSGKNTRESYTGNTPDGRIESFKGSQFENNDPVIFGIDIIFDTVNSPLLNGAVEDFITEFSYVSEIASKAIVIDDFKRQFVKIFKTRGNLEAKLRDQYSPEDVLINSQRQGQSMASNANSVLHQYSNGESPNKNLYRTGRKAYLGYYLQKVDGLANLVESNTGAAKKYLPDYRKDTIKLTFLEDLSLSMGTLAHLYKLLYWSKPNGKNLIPENLLRFNCDIVISECRNFNRIKWAQNEGKGKMLDVVKDNVSRYIYSLRDCQFWFDKMTHEDSIDMGNIKTTDTYEISFDYKYSALKFEKWVPDPVKFGKYVGYHGGAIWKKGNKGGKEGRNPDGSVKDGSFFTKDISTPKFYTVNTNSLRHNGVLEEIVMESYDLGSRDDDEGVDLTPPNAIPQAVANVEGPTEPTSGEKGEDEEDKEKTARKAKRKAKRKEGLEKFKEGSKNVAVKALKAGAGFVFGEVNNQIKTRANMLENTINKARNLLGIGGLEREPKRVYPRPYTPHSFGLFFDVRNELFNFLGDEVAGIIAGGMNTILPGTQMNFPFKMPNIGATVHQLTGKFSLYDLEATLIGKKKAKDAKKPFFDDSKYKGNQFWGQSINMLFNKNTKFTFPKLPDDLNFQGMALVKFGGGKGEKPGSVLPKPDFLKPKGNIFSDGNVAPAKMLETYSLPGRSSGKGAQRTYIPLGTKNFNEIGFGVTKGGDAQKYPAPITSGPQGKLYSTQDNLVFKYSNPSEITGRGSSQLSKPIGTKDFSQIGLGLSLSDPQKYPAPITSGPKGKLYSNQDNLVFKYSSPKDFSGRGETRTGKSIIGSTNYLYIGFPKSAQKYPDPIMGMNAWIQGTKGNLYSPNNNLLTRFSKPSEITGKGESQISKPIGTKDFSQIGLGNSRSNPQKYPAPITSGPQGKLYSAQDNLIFKYSNPSEITGKGESQISKPIGTKDFLQIGLGNSRSNPQKYPAPITSGPQGKLYSAQDNLIFKYSNPSELAGKGESQISKPIGTKDFSQIGLGNSRSNPQKYPAPITSGPQGKLYSAQDNLIFKYSNPSEITGKGESQISKPIGTKDFSQIGLGNSLSDPQKYPAPLTQKIASIESIVKSGTIWSYPVNDKKFGK